MKPTVVFCRVVTKPEYDHSAKRWMKSYEKYIPDIPHELVIIDRYADHTDSLFDDFSPKYIRYNGGGWDCGAWKFAGKNIAAELLVCFNSSSYITGPGWLERFVAAHQTHGAGLYGPLASYEISPHIRTPCMAFAPEVVNGFPEEVNDREDTYRFECMGYPSGTPNFTQWAIGKGYPVKLVTWSGVYDQSDWRKPEGVFRNADQQDLIVRDKHCDAYTASSDHGKVQLKRLADAA